MGKPWVFMKKYSAGSARFIRSRVWDLTADPKLALNANRQFACRGRVRSIPYPSVLLWPKKTLTTVVSRSLGQLDKIRPHGFPELMIQHISAIPRSPTLTTT